MHETGKLQFTAQSCTGVVVKPLTANLLYGDNTYKMGWTRKLSSNDLANLRGIDATAHLVQDCVGKALRAVMDELGLVYGAFDLSVSNDGLALVHPEGPLGAGNLLALRRVAPDTVAGRFLPWWGCFMRHRADHAHHDTRPHPCLPVRTKLPEASTTLPSGVQHGWGCSTGTRVPPV